MNYFAHGMRFVDRPYLLAGTALPDWLSVVDRRVRLRPRRVTPFADASGTVLSEVAEGVLQHLEDDRWFHETRAFVETSGELTRLFRQLLGPEDGFRPGFLGHVATELLLDAVLMDQNSERVDAYYQAVARVQPEEVEWAVNRMAPHPATRLAMFIDVFCREQFLRDYLQPERLLYRLNQVMRRIKLKPLPDETAGVLEAGRVIVARRAAKLLPPERFRSPTSDEGNTR